MTTQVQFRRGTTAEHAHFVGAQGELTIDTDKNMAVIHDGSTNGGLMCSEQDGKELILTLFSEQTYVIW